MLLKSMQLSNWLTQNLNNFVLPCNHIKYCARDTPPTQNYSCREYLIKNNLI